MMRCRIFGHDWMPVSFFDWYTGGANFRCKRCKIVSATFEGTRWKNRNSVRHDDGGKA